MPVFSADAMWRKPSVSSALSGASRGEDGPAPLLLYPFAVALRVRVLQIVCGIGGVVVGAVGWLEERQRVALGLGVPTGGVTVLAAATSIYFSRGFGGWSRGGGWGGAWGGAWRAVAPRPRAAAPLALLWGSAVVAHVCMLVLCVRSLMNIGCGSRTCAGVAGAQLALSALTLSSQAYMVRVDLRHDPAAAPAPRPSDAHCTAVSMVPLNSAVGTSGAESEPTSGSPQSDSEPRPLEPT